MKRYLLFISILLSLFFVLSKAKAQGNQNFSNGEQSTAVNFTGPGCTYSWTNDKPGIGLPPSGVGNIASFTGVNIGTTPIKATIIATPAPTGYAYISNNGSNSVSVINTISNTVVTAVGVGKGPFGIAISPDGSKVYVANIVSNTVSVIDAATNTELMQINVGTFPYAIAMSPDGSIIYVANDGSNNVSVISTATNTEIKRIPVGNTPYAIAISPDGSRVYVANNLSFNVSVINTATLTEISRIAVGRGPEGVVVSPDGKKIYVTNVGAADVSVIDVTNNSLITNITVGSSPEGISISPDGSKVYVANYGSNTVSVINTSTNSVTKTINVGTGPYGLAVSTDGSEVYVANSGSNNVSVIATATNTVTNTVAVGSVPDSQGNFVSPATTCIGSVVTFTITVNPTSATPVITFGPVSGVISACAGTASASPDIQQFTVSGSNLTNNIIAKAPPNFEVSLSAGSGYGSSVTLTQTGGMVARTVVYVRSAASATTGSISDNVVVSSGTASQNVAVTGTVNALPTADAVNNQTVNNEQSTADINFTGAANIFTWINDTPGIGLAPSGTGNIASFTAVNTGNTPVKATITATPTKQGFAYIANFNSNTVSVINTTTNAVVATIPVGNSPLGVAISPDESRTYITNSADGTISVINTSTNKVISTLKAGSVIYGVAVSADGSQLYVATNTKNHVSIINVASGAITGTIALKTPPYFVALSNDGGTLYASGPDAGTISVINTATNTVTATINVGGYPVHLCVSPDDSRMYVTGDNISVINTATNTIIATIPFNSVIGDITTSADGSKIYATDVNNNAVLVYNSANYQLITSIPVGVEPGGISISPDGRSVYALNEGSDNISVINALTNTVTTNVAVGSAPLSIGNFVSHNSACSGQPIKFTITVNPIVPLITTQGVLVGNIAACAGTASASPEVELINVLGTNLTNDIIATAPAGFEITLVGSNNYGRTATLKQTGGAVNQGIYVRSAATDAAANYMGIVVLSSTGAVSQDVVVNGIVSALPAVNAVNNQSPTRGTATAPVAFTGTGNTYTWTNDTPSIGLPPSGTGNIAAFTPVNSGTTPITATVTVTPQPSPGYAYITSYLSGNTSVINTETGAVVATLQVGTNPEGVAINPEGTEAYVANTGSSSISVIDIATNTVTSTIAGGSKPYGLAISPDGSRIYASDLGNNTVTVINTSTGQIIGTPIPVGKQPTNICITPDGNTVYVINALDETVSVIGTLLNSVITTISGFNEPGTICASRDDKQVYVTNGTTPGTVSIISTATNTITSSIQVGYVPLGMAISPDGGRLYVCNLNQNSISIINTATNVELVTVSVASGINGIAVSSDGSKVYVASSVSGKISVIDAATNQVTSFSAGVGLSSYDNFVSPGSTCSGPSKTFTITVEPTIPPVITATGSPSPLTTTYGTASPSTTFTISGTNMEGGILVTPPPGFEVSTDGISFSPTVNTGVAGTIAPTIIYIRLAATTAVGSYSGNIVLSSEGATSVNVAMPVSTVTPVPLTITANDVNKLYGSTLTSGAGATAFTATGLQNNETIGSVTMTYGTGSAATDAVGAYAGTISPSAPTGGTFTASNYIITPINGQINVVQGTLLIKADNKSKIAGTENPPLTLTYTGFVNNEDTTNLTTMPTVTTTATITSPVGKYPIIVSGAVDPNYAITYMAGILTVNPYYPTVVIPNTFTPNGDGINDYWDIKYLESYPKCTVDIYNRYGEKLYSSIGYPTPWDGKYKGNYLPSGTYYYIINLKNGSSLLSGFVAIIR